VEGTCQLVLLIVQHALGIHLFQHVHLDHARVGEVMHRPKTNAIFSKSLEQRMQWGIAVAGMEAARVLPGVPRDSVNV
jgi:hypothetical protein